MKQPSTCVSEIVVAVTSHSVFIVTKLLPLSIDTMCTPAENILCGLTHPVLSIIIVLTDQRLRICIIYRTIVAVLPI